MTRPTDRRTGLASLVLLLLLPGLLLFVLLILSIHRTGVQSAELRNAGVAASLAGTLSLADDALVTADPEIIRPLLNQSRGNAQRFATRNTAQARPAVLADADVIFGSTDWGFRGRFVPLQPNASNADWKAINSVEVVVRLADNSKKSQRVRAFFDTNLIGFRPTPSRPAPIAPFALFDDPTNNQGWSEHVAFRTDDVRWTGTEAIPGRDGLAEVQVFIGSSPSGDVRPPVLAQPLDIGSQPASTVEMVLGRVLTQTSVGIQPDDLLGGAYRGELRLDSQEREQPISSAGTSLKNHLADVAAALEKRLGERLVWPLFTEVEPLPTPYGTRDAVRVNGFAAARLIAVSYQRGDPRIRLTLQETVLATPTALTLPSLQPGEKAPPPQRSLGKVRLAG